MAKMFYTNIDLKQNLLQNAVIDNLATAPASPVVGQVYYDTTDKQLKMYKLICGDPTATPSTAEYAWRVVDGVVWKDNWAANTAYAVGDIVRAGTSPNIGLYLCITAHKSGTTIDTAKFEPLGGGAGSVQDVQVDGTSVLDTADNKAKIVLKDTDLHYDTTNKKLEVVNRTLRETTLDSGATSLVSNNKGDEGAVMKITKGTDFAAAVAVNDDKDLGAQIYNIDPSQGNKGTRINVGQEKIYYTKGQTSPAVTDNDEIAVKGDLANKVDRSTTVATGVTSLVSNNVGDGGACLKIEDTATANKGMAAVAVNNGTIGAQIYNIQGTGATDKAVVIDVTKDKAYYYTGVYKTATDRDDAKNEIATKGTSAVTVTKDTTPTTGYAATYTIKQNNTSVGTIDIPKDWLLSDAAVKQVKLFDGATEQHYNYGDLVIQTDSSAIYVVKKDTGITTKIWTEFVAQAEATTTVGKKDEKYLLMLMNVKAGEQEYKIILIKLTDLVPVIPEVKSVAGTLGSTATTVDVAIPTTDAGNINLKYMYTRTSIAGEECITDVKWDATNKKVTVSVAKAIGTDMDIAVFYSVM